MSSREVVGLIDPPDVRQIDPLACFAATLSGIDPALQLSESAVIKALLPYDLYDKYVGSKLRPARNYAASLEKIGIGIGDLYPAVFSMGEPDPTDGYERTQQILTSLDAEQKVLIAYPKRRPGETPFLHFAAITGYEKIDDEIRLTVLDTSETDGGIKQPTSEEFQAYVTPTDEVGVMAWTIVSGKAADQHYARPLQKWGAVAAIGTSLLTKPLWRKEDTGLPVPLESDHAVSCVIPTTDASIAFAEYGDAALARDNTFAEGYPRFVPPKYVRELSLAVTGSADNFPFPSRRAAEAAAYLARTYGGSGGLSAEVKIQEHTGIHWLVSGAGNDFNKDAWQNTGLGISSRQALAELTRPGTVNDLERRKEAETEIKNRITSYTDIDPEDIYLFPTGMAAIYTLNQALIQAYDGAPAAQFGFQYVDTREQRSYGPHRARNRNIIDFRSGNHDDLASFAADRALRGVMTEWPSNPLLMTPNYALLDKAVGAHSPIIIDDTVGTKYNLDYTALPDSVVGCTSSETKYFSAVGNVMLGTIALRKQSGPHYERVKSALDKMYEDTTWYEDAEELAKNSREFGKIMPVINQNALTIAQFLTENFVGNKRELQAVYHPSTVNTAAYEQVMKSGGGYGGLMTLRFNDPERAYRFFDAIKITGAPSLGTFYSIKCLYTWLAHKNELKINPDSVTEFGVVPDLVRFSIGIEDSADLQERFTEAMEISAR